MKQSNDYQLLAKRMNADPNGLMAEIFEELADENDAKILVHASSPITLAEISERTGLMEDDVEARLIPLFQKGLIYKSKKPDAIRYYSVRHIMQLHDATGCMADPPPRMIALWKRFMETEWSDAWGTTLDSWGLNGEVHPVRIIPIDQSIEPRSEILYFDDIIELMEKFEQKIAVTSCSCRVIDGSCGKPIEVCIQLGKAADYTLERGNGRAIDKAEAIAILKKCGEEGLVHCIENKRSPGLTICNCCGDCCENWVYAPERFIAPSRFRAVVDEQACNACEVCSERCFFDAIGIPEGSEVATVESSKCLGCGVCKTGCESDAIYMEIVREANHIPQ